MAPARQVLQVRAWSPGSGSPAVVAFALDRGKTSPTSQGHCVKQRIARPQLRRISSANIGPDRFHQSRPSRGKCRCRAQPDDPRPGAATAATGRTSSRPSRSPRPDIRTIETDCRICPSGSAIGARPGRRAFELTRPVQPSRQGRTVIRLLRDHRHLGIAELRPLHRLSSFTGPRAKRENSSSDRSDNSGAGHGKVPR